MLKELYGEKIDLRWKQNDKMTLAKRTHNKFFKQKKIQNKKKQKNQVGENNKKMQNRCTMYQLFKMNNAFKENLWKHKKKML